MRPAGNCRWASLINSTKQIICRYTIKIANTLYYFNRRLTYSLFIVRIST